MIETLGKIGEKLGKFLGSPKIGAREELRVDPSLKNEIFRCDTLASLLTYESFEEVQLVEETHGLFVNQNSVGFTLESIPLVGGDNTAHKTILGLFDDILEEGVSIQCLLLADHRIEPFFAQQAIARKAKGELFIELIKQRAKFLIKNKNASPRHFRFIFSLSMPGKPSYELYKKIIDKKKRAERALKSITYTYAWDPSDLLHFTSSFVNFNFSPIPTEKKWHPYETLASQIPSGGKVTVGEEQIRYEQKNPAHFKSYRATEYPEYWHQNLMGRLIGDFDKDTFRIQTPFFLQYGIHCPKQSSEESSYWRKSQLIEKQGQSGFLRKIIPSLEDEVSEVAHVRKALNEGAKFVRTNLMVGFWAEPERVEGIEQSLKSLFRMEEFKLQENRYIHLPALLSSLPMTWGEYANDLYEMSLLRTTLSNEACNFIPLQGEWGGTSSPGMVFVGRRGQILNINIFDGGTNYNAIVVGQSGSGKSVFMQELLMSTLGTGGKIYVLDVGGSFEKMCEVVGGQKIEFDRKERLCLNPFTHIPNDPEERNASIGALKSIISTMAHPQEGSSDIENALIEKAILATIDHKGSKGTISDIADYLDRSPEKQAKELAVMLGPYTNSGTYGKYFEGEGNIDFHNPMVLIELEQLKSQPELQSVVLQIFIMEVSQKVFLGDRKTPTVICIDEAWELLKAKQTAPFIETLARRLRKYNGALVVGTQSVEDFYQSPGAMAAYDNSSWAFLLQQKPESISAYAKKSGASEGKISALRSVMTKRGEYSEIMISDSSIGYSIARLILDPFSQLLYSTSAEDRKLVEPGRQRGLSITEAIKEALSNKGR